MDIGSAQVIDFSVRSDNGWAISPEKDNEGVQAPRSNEAGGNETSNNTNKRCVNVPMSDEGSEHEDVKSDGSESEAQYGLSNKQVNGINNPLQTEQGLSPQNTNVGGADVKGGQSLRGNSPPFLLTESADRTRGIGNDVCKPVR